MGSITYDGSRTFVPEHIMMNKLEAIFRRNCRNRHNGEVSLQEIINILVELSDGLRHGRYLWCTHAYDVMNKWDAIDQLNYMHGVLMNMQNYVPKVSEDHLAGKFEDLLWENLLLNDNLSVEIQKINRDYFFWDELHISMPEL